MEIFNELVHIKNSCVGLGFFDGVHLGHRALIEKLVSTARTTDSKSVILTFQSSPAEMFLPFVEYITTLREKESILELLGVDYIVEMNFNNEIRNFSPEEYIKGILYKYFEPKCIISGFNHTFGKNKQGTPNVLKEYADIYNYNYIEMPPYKSGDYIISSSLIKDFLQTGDIKKANDLLSKPFSIKGIVIEGNKIGRTIGFPTANIIYPAEKVKIPYGVYCAEVVVHGKKYKGMLNYGIKPSINSGLNKPVAEVHIIDFNKDIYGEKIEIIILNKIRDEQAFKSIDCLKEQIEKDLKQC